MIKRITVTAFFILANVLFLAHAVIPHHHHYNQICFKNSHCQHDDYQDDPDTNQDDHSHDGEKNTDDCVLKEPIVVISNQWWTDFKFYSTTDRSGLDDFHPYHLNNGIEFQIPSFQSLIYEQVDDSSYSSFVSASLGLRAPPVV